MENTEESVIFTKNLKQAKKMSKTIATRFHDWSAGHRVVNHESKCQHLHGHNYRTTFYIEAPALDALGRVMDFSVIKERLCEWLEEVWDHKTLIWENDPYYLQLKEMMPNSIVRVPFNPTAENMAKYLVEEIGPIALRGTNATLIQVDMEETRKCSAIYKL